MLPPNRRNGRAAARAANAADGNGDTTGIRADPRPRKVPKAQKTGRRGAVRRTIGRAFGRIIGLFVGLAVLGAGVGAVVGYTAYQRFSADLPTVDGLRQYQPRVMSRIYADNSHLIQELATERRIFVPYTAIPDLVKSAFVSAEDQNFWSHKGIDPVAILRAAVGDVQQMGRGRRPVGASTITQQVARNMLLGTNEVSLARKVREALLAMRIENTLSKERILEIYLNEIYLGVQSYGVAAAAQTYFNKSLDDLTIPEAAFLAALPKAPNNYNPFRFPDAARNRRDWVIDRMADDHVITQDQARAAKAEPIDTAPFRRPETVEGAGWFAEEVRRQLVDHFGPDRANGDGLSVRTSFNPALQRAAATALRNGLMNYDRAHGGWRGPVARLEGGAAARVNWTRDLAQVARPPGLLPNWTLAEVIDITDGEARLGWFDRSTGTDVPRVGALLLADTMWAHPVVGGHVGGPPKHMSDVVRPGDVVMVEPAAPAPPVALAAASKAGPRPDRLYLRQVPQVTGALVTLEPQTGRVLAMVGGWSADTSQFNRATQAERQPGSSFKPMVYLTALEQGISPSQKFLDAPFVQNMGAAGVWRPGNYENTFSGPTPLRIALEKSLNLVTIRVAQHVGMDAVAQTAIAFHVVDKMPKVLPAALGAVETTVLRQAGAYASLAMGGKEVLPTLVDSVQDRDGKVLWRSPALSCGNCTDPMQPPSLVDQRPQIADPQSVFQLINMMEGVVQRGTGVKAGQGLGRAIAGKTGTTQDFNDAWFVGFTPDLVTAVWMGYDTPQSLGEGETGGDVSAPIWHDFMAVALKDRPNLQFSQPDGVTLAQWNSGYGTVVDAFKPDQVPGVSTSFNDSSDQAVSAAAPGVDTSMGGLY
jgi:penicillin-binding protein 1A